jgi:hypothetical protein
MPDILRRAGIDPRRLKDLVEEKPKERNKND